MSKIQQPIWLISKRCPPSWRYLLARVQLKLNQKGKKIKDLFWFSESRWFVSVKKKRKSGMYKRFPGAHAFWNKTTKGIKRIKINGLKFPFKKYVPSKLRWKTRLFFLNIIDGNPFFHREYFRAIINSDTRYPRTYAIFFEPKRWSLAYWWVLRMWPTDPWQLRGLAQASLHAQS